MLQISGLKKTYGKVEAVKAIDLEVKKGEVVGLLGPNGAGKSTSISMISTLIKPDAGTMTYKGVSILEKPKEFQKILGVVPQEIALYPTLTGYENLKFWGSAYGLKGQALKKRIEVISEVIGISQRLKDKVDHYSGGMKRRLNIGAALLHEPEILIMDEPTVGIDPQSRNHILETIKALNDQGMTIIYTSHYMEEVEYLCDRIYIMDEGCVVASGSKDDLVAHAKSDQKIIVSFDQELGTSLRAFEGINSVISASSQGKVLTLVTQSKAVLMKEIIEVSQKENLDLLSIDVEKPNLESVFLQLTGKALRD